MIHFAHLRTKNTIGNDITLAAIDRAQQPICNMAKEKMQVPVPLVLSLEILLLLGSLKPNTASKDIDCDEDFTTFTPAGIQSLSCPSDCPMEPHRPCIGGPYVSGKICTEAIHNNVINSSGGAFIIFTTYDYSFQRTVYRRSRNTFTSTALQISFSFTISCSTRGGTGRSVTEVECPAGCQGNVVECGPKMYVLSTPVCAAASSEMKLLPAALTIYKYSRYKTAPFYPPNSCFEKPWYTFTGCPLSSYAFPRDNQGTDYVRYQGTVDSFNATTTCAWINKTKPFSNATIFSYFTPSGDLGMEMIVKHSLDSQTLEIKVNGSTTEIQDFQLQDGVETHLCVVFDAPTNASSYYIDGEFKASRPHFGNAVAGGGTLLLGQGPGLLNTNQPDPEWAFKGTIRNFVMWPRVLGPTQIRMVFRDCYCEHDYMVIPVSGLVQLHGAVVNETTSCTKGV